jgi:hypothetical protein
MEVYYSRNCSLQLQLQVLVRMRLLTLLAALSSLFSLPYGVNASSLHDGDPQELFCVAKQILESYPTVSSSYNTFIPQTSNSTDES